MNSTTLCPFCRHWSGGECLSLDRRLNRFHAAAGLANVQAMGCAFYRPPRRIRQNKHAGLKR